MIEFQSDVLLGYFIFLKNCAMPFCQKPLQSVRTEATYQAKILQALDHVSRFEIQSKHNRFTLWPVHLLHKHKKS